MENDHIQSLEKGLTVLRAFNNETPYYTLADMAKATGLSRAAARRVMLTLQSLGYVGSDGRRFHLRPRVLEVGYAYLNSFGLSTIAQPHLDSLNETLGEACSVGVLGGHDVVYIARAQGRRRMTTSMSIGTRLEATCTAVGRVLLAGCSGTDIDTLLATAPLTAHTPYTLTDPKLLRENIFQVGEQGWAVVDQELEIGFCTAAAPIRDTDGTVLAALNVGLHTARTTYDEIRGHVLPRILESADDIGRTYAQRRPAGRVVTAR